MKTHPNKCMALSSLIFNAQNIVSSHIYKYESEEECHSYLELSRTGSTDSDCFAGSTWHTAKTCPELTSSN